MRIESPSNCSKRIKPPSQILEKRLHTKSRGEFFKNDNTYVVSKSSNKMLIAIPNDVLTDYIIKYLDSHTLCNLRSVLRLPFPPSVVYMHGHNRFVQQWTGTIPYPRPTCCVDSCVRKCIIHTWIRNHNNTYSSRNFLPYCGMHAAQTCMFGGEFTGIGEEFIECYYH